MDFESYLMSSGYTDEKIITVNQTITSITSGIKSVTNIGSNLVFTLADDSTLNVAITGLSDNNYTTTEKNKLALLDSNILSKFTYSGQLLFDGNPIVGGSIDLSSYYNKNEIDLLLFNKIDSNGVIYGGSF